MLKNLYIHNKKIFLTVSVLLLMLIILVILFSAFKKDEITEIQNLQANPEEITRYDDIPKHIAEEKFYNELAVGSSVKVNTFATVENATSNIFSLKMDSGETRDFKMGENTILGDAWLTVNKDGTIIEKSFDSTTISILSEVSISDRVWVIYEPDNEAQYLIPESFVILK